MKVCSSLIGVLVLGAFLTPLIMSLRASGVVADQDFGDDNDIMAVSLNQSGTHVCQELQRYAHLYVVFLPYMYGNFITCYLTSFSTI